MANSRLVGLPLLLRVMVGVEEGEEKGEGEAEAPDRDARGLAGRATCPMRACSHASNSGYLQSMAAFDRSMTAAIDMPPLRLRYRAAVRGGQGFFQ